VYGTALEAPWTALLLLLLLLLLAVA
jgi:hypothetical protein